MTQIILEQIVMQFAPGTRPALDQIDLHIESGETLVIVGPSGCGKSTLLKVVAGLETPQSGRVRYNGYDVTDVRPQDRGIGFVFQDYALYPSKKGRGNLAYFFEVHERTAEEEEARVRETADLMGVDFEHLLGQMPDTLSGGQQQRVAIARCIVRDPQIFLMDEPIVNLDAKLRERTRIELKKLLRKFAITTLYVTHDQQEAVFMGDRIAVLREGKLEQVGTFDDLYYSPANLFVAQFIGSPPISLLPATIDRDAGQLRIGDVVWVLPDGIAEAGDDRLNGAVRVGIRPEAWQLDPQNQHESLSITVNHIERLPTEQAAFINGALVDGGTEHDVTILAPLDHQADQVQAVPDWEQVLWFAADDADDNETTYHSPGVPDLFF